jgi:hypothetical protein
MVKPSLIQVFFAKHWPLRLWFILVPAALLILFVAEAEPTFGALCRWPEGPLLVVVAVVGFAAGVLIALVLGWFVLGPLYYLRELANGGPFKPGDRVQVIAGQYAGRVTTVREGWQGNSVRVDLGEEACKAGEDVFIGAEIIRVRENGKVCAEGGP